MAAPHREGKWLKGIVILPPGICQPLWQAGTQLPAPAGLCHSGFLGTSFWAIFISEHLLMIPESYIGNNSCVAMPMSPKTLLPAPGAPLLPAELWHHAICPRFAQGLPLLTQHFTTADVLIFMPCPPTPFFSRVEMSFHLPHHVLGSTDRMELKVSS